MNWILLTQIRRRLSEEEGTLRSQAPFRVALCYPSPYAVGMSSLGYQTIYREIHLHPGASAERAFLPDSVDEYRRLRSPIVSYEGERRLTDFPVVAFSISYELELTGFLEMLQLSGIPPLRNLRKESDPLILAGGPLTNSNPLPLAPFVDLIALGEGEDLIHDFLDAAPRMRRGELLSHFAGRSGWYVPGATEGLPSVARASDSRLPARSQIVARDAVLSSMFLIEPERGCSRGCSYCVMRRTTNGGMRKVAPEKVLSLIPENARRVGLVGAAVTDHPGIREILRALVSGGREIGISSLRADRLDEDLVGLLARGGYRTLTTASDGASQRLRTLVNRRTTEGHLIRAAGLARKFGLERLKVYQLIGLPGETDADIDEMIRFGVELSGIVPVSLAISPFVAKRNTPLDGRPFEPVRSLERKLSKVRSGLKGRVEIRSASIKWSWVEFMLSQGGPNAGLAALEAWRSGGSFAAWKRAFGMHDVEPFPLRSAEDGRRNPPELAGGQGNADPVDPMKSA